MAMKTKATYIVDKWRLPFGKYEGRTLRQVPKKYVTWLVAEGVFSASLVSYILAEGLTTTDLVAAMKARKALGSRPKRPAFVVPADSPVAPVTRGI